ncbi:MAG: ATP-binding protein, partial [Desulfobacterales bacterium]
GHIVGTLSSGEDITQRKQAEMDLKRSHAQLRRLSAHLQSVREKERKNIVREIHDELGQTLTALKMDVSWLKKRIAPDEKILSEKIHSMLGTIDRVIVWVNEVSAKLRPRLLDELGVKDAIHWLAEDLQKRTDIQCTFSCNFSDFQFDNDLSTAIFRISQEALTNIVRHAKASRVQIDLNQQNGELILKITDNGKGITEKEINSSTSFGLMGMRERMHTWGGKVEISGSKNRGTTLVVKLPISKVQEVVK